MQGGWKWIVSCTLALMATAPLKPQHIRHIGVTSLKSRCDYCQMLFQDNRFGGEVETIAGDTLRFDATECMVAYLLGNTIKESDIREMWSVDFARPTELVEATSAFYVRSDKIESPMEVGVAAFGSVREADSLKLALGGDALDWKGVIALVRSRWFPERQRR